MNGNPAEHNDDPENTTETSYRFTRNIENFGQINLEV